VKDLAALKEQGILTEKEFAVQKARILLEATDQVEQPCSTLEALLRLFTPCG
jgi:hypothetical protein